MNARLFFAAGIFAWALAALSITQRTDAQSNRETGGKGIFSTLRVGQMVECKYPPDSDMPVITTYEDEETKILMRHKVKEIGHDYLALELDDRDNTGAIAETRHHASRIIMLGHVGKSRKPGSPATDDGSHEKTTKPGGKTGTTKKK